MDSNEVKSTFSDREFIAMTRAELSLMGRQDVAIERSWIDEDEPGYPFLLHVPVGSELTVPLKAMDGFFHIGARFTLRSLRPRSSTAPRRSMGRRPS